MMPEERPNLNPGEPWGEFDRRDLGWCVDAGQSVEEIADFLCRTPSEIRARIVELGLAIPPMSEQHSMPALDLTEEQPRQP
jgi:hypothetical protein